MMFVGFNLKIDSPEYFTSEYYKHGIKLFSDQKKLVQERLKHYVLDGEIISASRIESDWFPKVETDVFISHSYKDEELAISLAGWLYDNFRIKSFIDSCIWGYADDLIKLIDKDFCIKKMKPDGRIDTYDYDKRNKSTAHVHMILNAALQKMIDNTECLFFLNTPNSLLVDKVINYHRTASPWIYSELVFSKMVRKKKLSEYRTYLAHDSLYEKKQLQIRYNVKLDHLYELDDNGLLSFELFSNHKHPKKALDDLYTIRELIKKEKADG